MWPCDACRSEKTIKRRAFRQKPVMCKLFLDQKIWKTDHRNSYVASRNCCVLSSTLYTRNDGFTEPDPGDGSNQGVTAGDIRYTCLGTFDFSS